jgi:hypothetical protein
MLCVKRIVGIALIVGYSRGNMKVRLMLAVTTLVTAVATHWVDRTLFLDVRRIRAQEMMQAAAWLDEFYASDAGLQRPGGLCEGGRLDSGAIGAWLFESYLRARQRGSAEDARAAVVAGIRTSEEWSRKHSRQ